MSMPDESVSRAESEQLKGALRELANTLYTTTFDCFKEQSSGCEKKQTAPIFKTFTIIRVINLDENRMQIKRLFDLMQAKCKFIPGLNPLVYALLAGNLDLATHIILKRPDLVDMQSDRISQWTPLHLSVAYPKIAALLKEKFPDKWETQEDCNGLTPQELERWTESWQDHSKIGASRWQVACPPEHILRIYLKLTNFDHSSTVLLYGRLLQRAATKPPPKTVVREITPGYKGLYADQDLLPGTVIPFSPCRILRKHPFEDMTPVQQDYATGFDERTMHVPLDESNPQQAFMANDGPPNAVHRNCPFSALILTESVPKGQEITWDYTDCHRVKREDAYTISDEGLARLRSFFEDSRVALSKFTKVQESLPQIASEILQNPPRFTIDQVLPQYLQAENILQYFEYFKHTPRAYKLLLDAGMPPNFFLEKLSQNQAPSS